MPDQTSGLSVTDKNGATEQQSARPIRLSVLSAADYLQIRLKSAGIVVHLKFNRNKMSSLLEIICAAESAGELEEPVRKHRRYWVHPLHSSKEYNMKFQIF
ncbi:protein ALP1-like [Aphis craccivora]|uniref:Protein ALP1-like n=1 Tax=Aphis craccivora TaxID=307492 RepID=A0A6G0Z4Y3_APHCR|nr:protein ALP1-like [Aphis craccivora]